MYVSLDFYISYDNVDMVIRLVLFTKFKFFNFWISLQMDVQLYNYVNVMSDDP